MLHKDYTIQDVYKVLQILYVFSGRVEEINIYNYRFYAINPF